MATDGNATGVSPKEIGDTPEMNETEEKLWNLLPCLLHFDGNQLMRE